MLVSALLYYTFGVNGLTEINGTINTVQGGSHTGTCEPHKKQDY